MTADQPKIFSQKSDDNSDRAVLSGHLTIREGCAGRRNVGRNTLAQYVNRSSPVLRKRSAYGRHVA